MKKRVEPVFELMGDKYAGVSIKHGEELRGNSQDARNRGDWSGGASGLDLTVDTESRIALE